MTPAHPPLPTAWNFPFQPDAGSHTSILMSESLVGVNVAATRQNAGSAAIGPPPARPPPAAPRPAGGVKAPAGTACAIVIVASPRASETRPSHAVVSVGAPARATTVAGTATARPAAKAVATANRIGFPPLAEFENALIYRPW